MAGTDEHVASARGIDSRSLAHTFDIMVPTSHALSGRATPINVNVTATANVVTRGTLTLHDNGTITHHGAPTFSISINNIVQENLLDSYWHVRPFTLMNPSFRSDNNGRGMVASAQTSIVLFNPNAFYQVNFPVLSLSIRVW